MTRTFRTIWISDLHLGTRGCQDERVLDFLRHTESERLYLVGDLVDGWALARGWFWPEAHNTIVQKVLRKARKGTEVIYVPGNHDAFARQFRGLAFGGVDIARQTVHVTADGRALLVLHGDEFDGAVALAPWLSKLGAGVYEWALRANYPLNRIRRTVGLPYWSLSKFLKDNTKRAVQYVAGFEEAVAQRARDAGMNGVVCGHIHKPELRAIGGLVYANCGDWVESCTALVEHFDGRLEILHWPEPGDARQRDLFGDPEAGWPLAAGDGLAGGVPTLAPPAR